jgi:chromosome segregation ATPase
MLCRSISTVFELLSMKVTQSQSKVTSLEASLVKLQGQAVSSERMSQEQINAYDGAVEQLERDVSELHSQLAKSNQRVQELENQIRSSSGSARQLVSLAEEKRQALVEEYESVIEGLRSDRAALVRKMESLCEKISSYQDQIAELLMDRDNFAQKYVQTEENAAEIIKRVSDLEAENQQLREQVQHFEFKSQDPSEAEALEGLRKDRAMLYAALDDAGKENIALREKLFESSKDVRKLHSLLEKADAQLAAMEKEREVELNKFQQRIHEFNEREAALRLTLEETMENYRVERASLITSYETQLSNQSDDVVAKYQDIVSKLREDLKSFDSLREQWLSIEKGYKVDIERLTFDLSQAQDELKEMSEMLKEPTIYEHQLKILQSELKESQQNCSLSTAELQKLRKDHDIALIELRVASETAVNLRLSLETLERSLKEAQSVESILRLQLSESESKMKEMERLREDGFHSDKESRQRMEDLLEENAAFAACIEEFERKFASMNHMLKEGHKKQTALIEECSRLGALVHSKDEELESALLRYQALASNPGFGKSESSSYIHEKIVELTEKFAKMQFDYNQVCAQLREKSDEIDALRSVSIDRSRSTCAADDFVLQSRWRDELWTQGLELQSAVTDLTSILRSIESGMRATKAANNLHSDDSSANETETVASSKPRLSTRLRVKIESRKQSVHSELAGVNQILSEIMDRLHIFQTTLLTPPWEDKTVEQATEELIKGKLVQLKYVESLKARDAHGLKYQATVFKAIIKMLLRVMRKKIATKSSKSQVPYTLASSNEAVIKSNTAAIEDVPLDYSMDCGAQGDNEDVVNYSRSSVWDISSDEGEAETDSHDEEEDLWKRNPILGFI